MPRDITLDASTADSLRDRIDAWEGYGENHPSGTLTYGDPNPSFPLPDRFDSDEMLMNLARDFIWWNPINQGEALYLPTEYTDPFGVEHEDIWCDGWRIDPTYNMVISTATSTSVNFIIPNSFGNRDAGSVSQGSIRVIDDLLVPDASPGNTPNNCALVVNRDTFRVNRLNAYCHPTAGGPVWAYNATSTGAHTGSGLTGGCIDIYDLNRGYINHALSILINQPFLSEEGTGFVAPAKNADSDYNTPGNPKRYTGTNEWIKMGSEFAIPPETMIEPLELETEEGKMTFNAAKKYGCILTDTAGWTKSYFSIDYTAIPNFQSAAVERDMIKIMAALRVVIETDQ